MMPQAVERITRAIESGEQITVFTDYDADGLTGAALLISVLRSVGAHPHCFIPNRLTDGYGLTENTLIRCFETFKPDLIITTDCGTGSVAATRKAADLGMDVVITDHHQPSEETAPAVAVVNPKLDGNENTSCLAGVGVVFKLCHALVKHWRDQNKDGSAELDLRTYLDLVAVGTVADIVPLTGENRILVKHGLSRINSSTTFTGLAALIEVAGIQTAIDCYHIGFLLGPRLNAAGRVETADPALELLLTADRTRALHLASELDRLNRKRQGIEKKVVAEAATEIDSYFNEQSHFGIVAGREGWHTGILGIVASRLCRRYNRPAIVIGFDNDGTGRGSCRSLNGINLVETLEACSDLLVSFGGHAAAAGLVIKNNSLDTFRQRFNTICSENLKPEDMAQKHTIDAWITLGQANEQLYADIQKLQPLGEGNPIPLWGTRNVTLVQPPRIVGENHLKMTLGCGASQLEGIAFGMAGTPIPDGPMDILFRLQENHYMNRRSLQLNVQALRPSETGPA
jgi:single-stranded-DNA-specific exonuclease